ncbi:glycosyltransferase [Flavobacteriaceae bacterium]|nr:glycosyltransferase [Flavobacteriaceae bacterium]
MNLSIIIPVYNCARYLLNGFEYLKPIYNSNIDFEIIYVNDGSTDNSLSLLNDLQNSNKYIQVVSQENQGSSGARNTAIEIAKGEFIQFLDSDDLLDAEKIINMLYEAKQNNFDLYGYKMDFVDENYNQVSEKKRHPLTYNKSMSGIECLIEGYQPSSICVFLFKRALLINNNLRIYPKITHMDIEFMTRVMLCAKKVIFKDTIAYHYLQRPGSITKPKTKEKLEKFIFDEVTISKLMKENIQRYKLTNKETIDAVKKNYNSVIWNLLWRFVIKPQEVDYDFKIKCLSALKDYGLYPVEGKLKTSFQKVSRLFFNSERFLKLLLKR